MLDAGALMRLNRDRMRVASLAPLLAVSLGGCVTAAAAPIEWTTASPDPAVITIAPARYGPISGASERVREECKLDRLVPERIAGSSPVAVALAEDPAGAARVLHIRVWVTLPVGETFSGVGPFLRDLADVSWTSMTIVGELFETRGDERRRVASFEAKRMTSGGVGSQACKALSTVSNRLAQDVAYWLAEPTLGARLGLP